MSSSRVYKNLVGPFLNRNWEADINQVAVEPCSAKEDPLGYRAVFFFKEGARAAKASKIFVIGASYLAKREQNLSKAGYKAPMTHKAIALIESKLGARLPVLLA